MGRPGAARTNTEVALEQRGVPVHALSRSRSLADWRRVDFEMIERKKIGVLA